MINQEFADQVAIHNLTMPVAMMTQSYGTLRQYDEDKQMMGPVEIIGKSYDIYASMFMQAIVLHGGTGTDCRDKFGNDYEVKLVKVYGDKIIADEDGQLFYGSLNSYLRSSINANYRVYKGTKEGHHNKVTVLVLYSMEHRCFIAGFIMRGEDIEHVLRNMKKTSVERVVTLNDFLNYGYEIGSVLPYIGWSRYVDVATRLSHAKQGLLTEEEKAKVIDEWITFADQRTLQRLV